MPMSSYSVLLSRSTWNTAPIISGLLFFTKRSQNYHTVFTQGMYHIDNETRGAKLLSNKTAERHSKKGKVNYEKKFTLYAENIKRTY